MNKIYVQLCFQCLSISPLLGHMARFYFLASLKLGVAIWLAWANKTWVNITSATSKKEFLRDQMCPLTLLLTHTWPWKPDVSGWSCPIGWAAGQEGTWTTRTAHPGWEQSYSGPVTPCNMRENTCLFTSHWDSGVVTAVKANIMHHIL